LKGALQDPLRIHVTNYPVAFSNTRFEIKFACFIVPSSTL
jgi:hypothetical protein